MRRLTGAMLAACLCATGAAADTGWEPLTEPFAPGTAACGNGDVNIICAAILCEEGRLTIGILGTGHGGVLPPFGGAVEVDGQLYRRTMEGRIVNGDFLHTRTPLAHGSRLFSALRAGRDMRLYTYSMSDPFAFALDGLAPELDRVSGACR